MHSFINKISECDPDPQCITLHPGSKKFASTFGHFILLAFNIVIYVEPSTLSQCILTRYDPHSLIYSV